jgi:dihydropyrimidinase
LNADLLVQNGTVVTPGGVVDADVLIEGGKIAAVGSGLRAAPKVDATGCYVIPGVVDPHVHVALGAVSRMGPICEDVAAATRSAVMGGVTSMGVYVQRSGERSVAEVVRDMCAQGPEVCATDFWCNAIFMTGDAIERGVEECVALGVTSFKAMLAYRVRDMMLEDDDLLRLMFAAQERNALVIVHPENGRATEVFEERERARGVTPESYLRTSPGVLEAEGMFRAGAIAQVAGCRLLFAHLSAKESVDVMAWLRARGDRAAPVSCETQPHYLLLSNDEVLERGPLGKVGPPLREKDDVEAVRSALRRGLVNHLCSDHSPRTKEAKLAASNILDAPYGGIAGTEVLLPLAHRLVVEEGAGDEDDRLARLVQLTSANAARMYGVYPAKGRIGPGADGDLVLLPKHGPAKSISPELLHGAADYSLYDGITSTGFAKTVIRAGHVAVADGELVENPPARYLGRGHHR